MPPPLRKTAAKSALDLSGFQPMGRDFAFVVKRDVGADQVTQAADKAVVSRVSLFNLSWGRAFRKGKSRLGGK
jgi:phenylalanyl-tRNA synthetase beta chain